MFGYYIVRLNGNIRHYWPIDFEFLLNLQCEGWDDKIEILGYVG